MKDRFRHYVDQGISIDELNSQVEVTIDFIINFWFHKDAFLLRLNEAQSEDQQPVEIDNIDDFESYFAVHSAPEE